MDYLGISATKLKPVIKELNQLLADYHIYYQNLRCFHWNVVGQNFFDLHEIFEELYNDAKIKIDEIAERVLTLRSEPKSKLSEYIEMTNIEERNVKGDEKMLDAILSDHKKLIAQFRTVIEEADKAGDEGTIDMIGGFLGEIEKKSWMIEAWRSK